MVKYTKHKAYYLHPLQFSGIKYIHTLAQPSTPSISKPSCKTETVYPLINNAGLIPPIVYRLLCKHNITLGMELLGHVASVYFNFIRKCQTFSELAISFALPPAMYMSFQCSVSLLSWCCSFLMLAI